MISRIGHITSAIMCIRRKLHWNSYFKAIERGRFSWLALARQWLRLLIQLFQLKELILTLDDFITVRASKKAPSVGLHNYHAKRSNRPQFIWGQLRLSLGIICKKDPCVACFPLLLRLMRSAGNTSTFQAATFLMKPPAQTQPSEYGGENAYRRLVHACSPGSGTDSARRSAKMRLGICRRLSRRKRPEADRQSMGNNCPRSIFCSSTRTTR